MTLIISLEQSCFTLKLSKNSAPIDPALFIGPRSTRLGRRPVQERRGVDIVQAFYYHDLSSLLITALDKLLKKNRINPTVLKAFKIKAKLGQDSTSHKIASSFVQALKIDF